MFLYTYHWLSPKLMTTCITPPPSRPSGVPWRCSLWARGVSRLRGAQLLRRGEQGVQMGRSRPTPLPLPPGPGVSPRIAGLTAADSMAVSCLAELG